MRTSRGFAAALAAAALLLSAPPAAAPLAAQSLADRVAAAPSGTVRMSFAARPGVCGRGEHGISIRGGGHITRHGEWQSEWEDDCEPGPVRVALDVSGHRVTALRTYVGGRWIPGGDATDLGTVAAPAAAAYLLTVARTADAPAAKKAVFAATLADSATVWPALLRIARNDARPRAVRKAAVFWVGQAAGDVVAPLSGLAADETEDEAVRKAAVFALSQRPHAEGVPALIAVVRQNHDPRIRRQALFWLGQSHDPRALDLFEQILTGH